MRQSVLLQRCLALACLAPLILRAASVEEVVPKLSDERVVFQIAQGDIEFAFFPEVAPVTSAHIFHLVQLGLYTSNNFFRIDKGFVAQTSDVMSRTLPLNEQQRAVASKNVPLEVKEGVKHKEGVLSMGRYDDPNSGTSSFSMLLGVAGHLDMQYTIFARVTKGLDVLHKLEELPTKREGIFVMPLDRITILNTYWYRISTPAQPLSLEGAGSGGGGGGGKCVEELSELKTRFESQAEELQRVRRKCLPGT